MFTNNDVTQWMSNAPEIPISDLTEQDVIVASEAFHVYRSWQLEGSSVAIERYWGNPSPSKDDLAGLKRGFEVLSQYTVHSTPRSTFSPDHLPDAVIETTQPAGYVAMSPAERRVGLYPREARQVFSS